MNTPSGKAKSTAYNQNLRLQTMRFAMVEQLRNPSPGFEEVIRHHFRLVRRQVYNTARQWLMDARASTQTTTSVLEQFESVVAKLKVGVLSRACSGLAETGDWRL
jgi:hypothetical protein